MYDAFSKFYDIVNSLSNAVNVFYKTFYHISYI